MTALRDIVVEIRNGVDLDQHADNDAPDLVAISRIETISAGVVDFARVKYARASSKVREQFLLRVGDILFSHINSPEHIGKTALYRSGKPLIHGINLLVLRLDSTLPS